MAFIINATLRVKVIRAGLQSKQSTHIPLNLAEEFPIPVIALSQVVRCNQDFPAF
jgi:hypothetical protein